jgi:hypothetical protein
VLRQKRQFKVQEMKSAQKQLIAGTHPRQQTWQDHDDLVATSENLCMSPLRAIVSPKVLGSFQPAQ